MIRELFRSALAVLKTVSGATSTIVTLVTTLLGYLKEAGFNIPLPSWVWWSAAIASAYALNVYLMIKVERKAVEQPRPDLNAGDAFELLLKRSKWARMKAAKWTELPPSFYESHLSDAQKCEQRVAIALAGELHDLMRQGFLTGWAREERGTPMEKLSPERWSDVILVFDAKALAQSPKNVCAWDRNEQAGDRIIYMRAHFCRAELLHQFPLSWWSRKVDTGIGTQALDTVKI